MIQIRVKMEFDYDDLGSDIRQAVEQQTDDIRVLVKQTAQNILTIGGKLLRVKEALDHGQFGTWLSAEFGWTDRTARNFMRVAERFKSEIISDLTNIGSTVLYLLAAPSTPDEVVKETFERVRADEKPTVAEVKEKIATFPKPVRFNGTSPPIVADDDDPDIYYEDGQFVAQCNGVQIGSYDSEIEARSALSDYRLRQAQQQLPKNNGNAPGIRANNLPPDNVGELSEVTADLPDVTESSKPEERKYVRRETMNNGRSPAPTANELKRRQQERLDNMSPEEWEYQQWIEECRADERLGEVFKFEDKEFKVQSKGARLKIDCGTECDDCRLAPGLHLLNAAGYQWCTRYLKRLGILKKLGISLVDLQAYLTEENDFFTDFRVEELEPDSDGNPASFFAIVCSAGQVVFCSFDFDTPQEQRQALLEKLKECLKL